jgi:nucleoporin p58/p45
LAEKIKAAFPAHREAVETIPTDVSVLSNRLASTKSFQHSDQMAYEQVRAAHQEDEEASKLSIRTLDLFAIPHAQRSQYMRSSSFATPQRENDVVGNKPMIAYFNKQANEMEHKMEIVKRVVRQVEESLQSVESQAIQSAREVAAVGGQDRAALTGGVTGRQDAKRLNNVLREFNDALKGVSGRVADAREGLEALKQKR